MKVAFALKLAAVLCIHVLNIHTKNGEPSTKFSCQKRIATGRKISDLKNGVNR